MRGACALGCELMNAPRAALAAGRGPEFIRHTLLEKESCG